MANRLTPRARTVTPIRIPVPFIFMTFHLSVGGLGSRPDDHSGPDDHGTA
jgi:hypothetical protein